MLIICLSKLKNKVLLHLEFDKIKLLILIINKI